MPSFNIRPVIAAFFFLFGFFFLGFLPRAFAVDKDFVPNLGGYPMDICLQWNGSTSNSTCGASAAAYYCDDQPGCSGYISSVIDPNGGPSKRYLSGVICGAVSCDTFTQITCNCCDDQLSIESCYSDINVVWTNDDTCQFDCKCPDYTGQELYNFDTCSMSGNCEEEYQEAKQSCDNPQLLDSLTCEYTCTCVETYAIAEETCIAGYYFNSATCQYSCKCCIEKSEECQDYCGGGDNIKNFSCTDTSLSASDYTPGGCAVDSGSYVPCECIIPPIHDLDPPPQDPEPDPDDSGDDPGDGKTPDPSEDPDNPDNTPRTCAEVQALKQCYAPCQWSCVHGSDGNAVSWNCDCDPDPADPNDPDNPGSADDGSNGWLKQIEENTDKVADGIGDANGWLKAIKGNTDELLEDTDNIAENVRRGIENDKRYFTDGSDRSVFKDSTGKSYLQTIAEKDFSGSGEFDITLPDNITVDIGEVVLPDDNEYSTSFDETDENGERILDPLPESTFETDLTSYIASGIPLFDYIKNTSIDLSSVSPVLSLNILGQPVSVDFSRYEATINKAGDILFYLTVISCFILIITRAKG